MLKPLRLRLAMLGAGLRRGALLLTGRYPQVHGTASEGVKWPSRIAS